MALIVIPQQQHHTLGGNLNKKLDFLVVIIIIAQVASSPNNFALEYNARLCSNITYFPLHHHRISIIIMITILN